MKKTELFLNKNVSNLLTKQYPHATYKIESDLKNANFFKKYEQSVGQTFGPQLLTKTKVFNKGHYTNYLSKDDLSLFIGYNATSHQIVNEQGLTTPLQYNIIGNKKIETQYITNLYVLKYKDNLIMEDVNLTQIPKVADTLWADRKFNFMKNLFNLFHQNKPIMVVEYGDNGEITTSVLNFDQFMKLVYENGDSNTRESLKIFEDLNNVIAKYNLEPSINKSIINGGLESGSNIVAVIEKPNTTDIIKTSGGISEEKLAKIIEYLSSKIN